MQGRFDEAGADFARAYNRDPLDATAVHARGVMISRTGNVPEGEVEMNRAIATNRQAIEFFSNAGLRP